MGSLGRAMATGCMGLVALAGLTDLARAGDGDAYHPADAGRSAPRWERAKSTRFSATRCSAGAAVIDQLVISRAAAADKTGLATYTDTARGHGREKGAGGWTLEGSDLKVSGDGFELTGRWVGAQMTATITRAAGGAPARCRYEVAALRSFTQYQ